VYGIFLFLSYTKLSFSQELMLLVWRNKVTLPILGEKIFFYHHHGFLGVLTSTNKICPDRAKTRDQEACLFQAKLVLQREQTHQPSILQGSQRQCSSPWPGLATQRPCVQLT